MNDKAEQQTARIENWALVTFLGSPPFLVGEIKGHPLLGDSREGHEGRTSTVMRVNGRQVVTRNTVYELGEPRENFKDAVTERFGWNDENPLGYVADAINGAQA